MYQDRYRDIWRWDRHSVPKRRQNSTKSCSRIGFLLFGYACSAGRFCFRLRVREWEQEWGNHSSKTSDSDCLHRPSGACIHYTHLHRWTKDILCADSRNRSWKLNLPALYALRRLEPILWIGVGTWICLHYTLWPTGADSRNRSRNQNLPALYALRRIAPILGIGVGTWICLHYTLCADWSRFSDSESEPESACTIRFAPTSADSRNRSRNLNLPALFALADWRRLSESESEPESACTIRVPFVMMAFCKTLIYTLIPRLKCK
jgi:hypothetical protein